jgi:hypothetical protein
MGGGVERRSGACGVLVGKVEGKGPLGRRCLHKSIILKWMFMKWNRGHGLDFSGAG